MRESITEETLRRRRRDGEPISGLTAYDYPTAVLIDRSGLDLILVGDTLGKLILGKARPEDTTLEDMIHHCAAVSRGAHRAMVIGDMPFGTYEISPDLAAANAIRLVKEGGVGAVKLEGGREVAPAVRALTRAHITVIGHLTIAHASGNTVEQRSDSLIEAALALEEAGAAAIVLVGLPAQTAASITSALSDIPTIGYRSGPRCDGQLWVTPYMLGLLPPEEPAPGPYGSLGKTLQETFTRFREDVEEGRVG